MSDTEPFPIEVAFALPDRQKIVEVLVEPGTTARIAVAQSKIQAYFPEIDLDHANLGVFGQALGTKGLAAPEQYHVRPGDRIEIYRPLLADPKEVRRRKAAEKKAAKS